MNRDEGSPYQLSHIWDKLLVTSEKPEVIPDEAHRLEGEIHRLI